MSEINDCDLPRGIKASSLVDISKLNLKSEASDRVAMKISEAVLAEYASARKPASLFLAGKITNIFQADIPDILERRWWVGFIDINVDFLREHGFAVLDKSIPQLLENVEVETVVSRETSRY